MGKISFDNYKDFLVHLRKVDKEEIEIEIIKCIAIHKSGIATTNAHDYIEGFLKRNDRNVIMSKLVLLSEERDYIYLCHSTESYKFNYEKYDIKGIPYVVENAIIDGGVAVSGWARMSLEETMKKEESCIYLFMAITSINYFEELLNNRIQKGRKTVIFFPHRKCININANSSYDDDLNSWSQYMKKDNINNFLDFYFIKNKNYKQLYSSCLTENIVRYNYYEYRKDGKIRTGGGRVQIGIKDTSFYDIIRKEYEKAFYERIPMKKSNIKEYIPSLFRRHLIKTIIILLGISAIGSYVILDQFYPTLSSTISSIFVLFTMIIGFLQNRINDNLKRGQIKFELK